MNKIYVFLACLFLFASCGNDVSDHQEEYPRWIGDIQHDDRLDADFTICHTEDAVLQYFHMDEGPVYPNEKPQLIERIMSNYQAIRAKDQSGLIRIRFVVNCQGKAGRFRVMSSDLDFKEKTFDKRVIDQLTESIESIDQWKILYRDSEPVDYYFYIIVKLVDGEIKEILP